MGPEHISYYQLTLEPNTLFHRAPPPLPDDDLAADMHDHGLERLAAAGYAQYEVSAHARPGRRCRHNLNYWEFGDYLGCRRRGPRQADRPRHRAGRAHRQARHPDAYLAAVETGGFVSSRSPLADEDLALEFALFALRLNQGFEPDPVSARTGLPYASIRARVAAAQADGLLEPGLGESGRRSWGGGSSTI